MEKVNHDPMEFLYKGEDFDNVSVGWFIRAIDKQVPDWRDLFEDEFGAYPGFNCFNPDKRLPGMVNLLDIDADLEIMTTSITALFAARAVVISKRVSMKASSSA